MKIGSLCSGYGGLDSATIAAFGGGSVAWHCEVDDAASHILKTHHPDVPNHGSVVGADWSMAEPVHLLTMGPPCQPVSAAGRQRAEADPRWLWPDALRAIHALRPRGVVFENVRNLISIRKGAVWRGILDDFREAGYAVRWLTLGACTVGAPHHRHRVFALAARVNDPGEDRRVEVRECDAVRSLLPTPTARDGMGGPGHAASGGLNLRTTAVRLIPAPRGSDGRNGGPNQGIASGDPALSSAVMGDRWGQFAAAVAHWEGVLGRPAVTGMFGLSVAVFLVIMARMVQTGERDDIDGQR